VLSQSDRGSVPAVALGVLGVEAAAAAAGPARTVQRWVGAGEAEEEPRGRMVSQ
jgi:hypothetical protein